MLKGVHSPKKGGYWNRWYIRPLHLLVASTSRNAKLKGDVHSWPSQAVPCRAPSVHSTNVMDCSRGSVGSSFDHVFFQPDVFGSPRPSGWSIHLADWGIKDWEFSMISWVSRNEKLSKLVSLKQIFLLHTSNWTLKEIASAKARKVSRQLPNRLLSPESVPDIDVKSHLREVAESEIRSSKQPSLTVKWRKSSNQHHFLATDHLGRKTSQNTTLVITGQVQLHKPLESLRWKVAAHALAPPRDHEVQRDVLAKLIPDPSPSLRGRCFHIKRSTLEAANPYRRTLSFALRVHLWGWLSAAFGR